VQLDGRCGRGGTTWAVVDLQDGALERLPAGDRASLAGAWLATAEGPRHPVVRPALPDGPATELPWPDGAPSGHPVVSPTGGLALAAAGRAGVRAGDGWSELAAEGALAPR